MNYQDQLTQHRRDAYWRQIDAYHGRRANPDRVLMALERNERQPNPMWSTVALLFSGIVGLAMGATLAILFR